MCCVARQALNTSLRDQMEDLQQKQQQEEDSGFKPSELKKRLRKFTHDFKTNKVRLCCRSIVRGIERVDGFLALFSLLLWVTISVYFTHFFFYGSSSSFGELGMLEDFCLFFIALI